MRRPVCGLSVSERHCVHSTCRPETRAAAVETDNMDVDGLALPSSEAIQAGRMRTLRHVPLAARHARNQVLTRALAVHHNSVETWLELLMLPQCVLCAPGRGRRRHTSTSRLAWLFTPAAARYTQCRCCTSYRSPCFARAMRLEM